MNGSNDNKTISKTNAGFPPYLDFDKLRTEGIDYLGKISGKIWTDHNVHDPGITILEMLCYSLLDLGYRTNLPLADILARDPADTSKDDNFFTPAQILACNPLTITDFRKLLIDIEGVKNAWLEIADDFNPEEFCPEPLPSDPAVGNTALPPASVVPGAATENCCINYLNGLYHVYIELEKNIENEFSNDDEGKKKYLDDIIKKIKEALMAHRNLCEDFIDIKILCRQNIGVCADIELEEGADAETVFLKMVEKLQDYFSPSPRFYTLQQLLDEKKKNIEEIFAGRPYNISGSHGFVDTEEFEKLHLKKEIHLSDVYNVLFEVEGIIRIQNLRLKNCGQNKLVESDKWVFPLLQNHIPEFSLACSGFTFTRNGMTLKPDISKYAGIIEMNFRNNGKILYKQPSPYLDAEIPKGVYRPDMGDYCSIQNEFPRVYGIAEGGLPADASSLRKAQALQLKAYLLFFDQLLANYLSQLKNIRSLFSVSLPGKEKQHSYFIQQPDSVPELQSLLRFKIKEETESMLGSKGSVLAIPVSKKHLQTLIDTGEIRNTELEKDFPPYYFVTANQSETAVKDLQNDLLYGEHEPVIVSTRNECWFFYLITSSCEFALVSRRYYKNEQEAKTAAASLIYAGSFDENFRTFIHTSANTFSFDVELNLSVYAKYLQLVAEDEELYSKRRQQFLNHLLSRFAERFTDYALLSYGFAQNYELEKDEIQNKERFLTGYDDLSSNRGKAYDYRLNGWNNDNVSGTEKRFKALSGIENWKRHSLCNFEVYKYDAQYVFALKIAGKEFFKSDEKFDTPEDAQKAAQSLFEALSDPVNYSTEPIPHEMAYGIQINYAAGRKAVYPIQYSHKELAEETSGLLHQMFSRSIDEKNISESRYRYKPYLKNYTGIMVARFSESYDTREKAWSAAFKKINDRKKWEFANEPEQAVGKLYSDTKQPGAENFIDLDAFKIDINDTIVDKPDKFTYEALDKKNNFKFRSVNEFDSRTEAQQDSLRLLLLLADDSNYRIDTDEEAGNYFISLVNQQQVQAVYSTTFDSRADAEKIKEKVTGIVKQHQYYLTIDKTPDRWKFQYRLGFEHDDHYVFESDTELYESKPQAEEAAQSFSSAVADHEVKERDSDIVLTTQKKKGIPTVRLVSKESSTPYNYQKIKKSLDQYLDIRKEINRLQASSAPAAFSQSVGVDEMSRCGQYVYRLVDNDNLLADSPVKGKLISAVEAEVKRKTLIQQATAGYDYLELALGGNVINKRKEVKTKRYWYHYQLRPLRRYYKPGDPVGKDLILFESTQGYSNKEEAEKAFNENYLLIIHYASDIKNYGEKKLISDKEILIHTGDSCVKNDSIVFIPQETLNYLGAYTEDAEKELVKITKSYPVRMIRHHSKTDKTEFGEFNDRFPCEKKEFAGEEDECAKDEAGYVYYFILYNKQTGEEDWQSLKYYASAEEAKKAFWFFLLLLRYPGNYFVDCDPCHESYKVYIREVLAESAERFKSAEEAWWKNGIQKFICISQTPKAFHTYLKKEGCCYTFYTACHETALIHPCWYDTPEARDKALDQLYYSFLKQGIKKLAYLLQEPGTRYIVDGDDKRLAEVIIKNYPVSGRQDCGDWIIELICLILTKGLCIKDDKQLLIELDDNASIEFIPVDAAETLKELKSRLLCLAYYFPIVMKKEIKSGQIVYKYCIELKFGDYQCCDEKEIIDLPCDCEDDNKNSGACYIAWKSKCCYSSCEEAIHFYREGIKDLLTDYKDYRGVFECTCGPFGIALHHQQDIKDCKENDPDSQRRADNLVIAVNPQCYPDPEMACHAVDRAKKLINAEGLHLAEHILLRPHCKEEDCQCEYYKKHCETECGFTWYDRDEDDPCDKTEPVCFVPGSDPYSFIATVALPAWPERFRKKENRNLIETILRREAPAHVLLRILWLAPHDLCCFEMYYKKWGWWLAQKNVCGEEFNVCDWLKFLFDRNYECLSECDVCKPCEGDEPLPDPCKEEETDEETNRKNEFVPDKFLKWVNQLFCWKETDCYNYEYRHCNGVKPVGEDLVVSISASVSADETNEIIPEPDIDSVLLKPKPAFVNQRLKKYKDNIHHLAASLKASPAAGMAKSFLDSFNPSAERFIRLAEEILNSLIPTGKGKKAPLNKKHAEELLKNSMYHYLDKVCFNGKDIEKIKSLVDVFGKMKKAGINMLSIYRDWQPEEVKKYEPHLDINEIQRLLSDDRNK